MRPSNYLENEIPSEKILKGSASVNGSSGSHFFGMITGIKSGLDAFYGWLWLWELRNIVHFQISSRREIS